MTFYIVSDCGDLFNASLSHAVYLRRELPDTGSASLLLACHNESTWKIASGTTEEIQLIRGVIIDIMTAGADAPRRETAGVTVICIAQIRADMGLPVAR